MKQFAITILMFQFISLVNSIPPYKNSNENNSLKMNHSNKLDSTLYECPMHPEIQSYSPGKCNKCGMELTKVDGGNSNLEIKNQNNSRGIDSLSYFCTMHSEQTSSKPGKCTKCGMQLIKTEINKNNCKKPNHRNKKMSGCGMM